MSKIFSPLIYYVIVIPISHLPFGVLYFISDIVYFLLYYIVGYRKKVVRENLQNSFPELTREERAAIEKKFYKHFADFLVESTKSLSISNKAIRSEERRVGKECRSR